MALYISVVNHNHDEMICANPTLKNLSKQHTVILKSNTPATRELQTYCRDNDIILIQGKTNKGFGANNNEIFRYAQSQLKMKNDDFFLVLNPDVEITLDSIDKLLDEDRISSTDIAAINLYKDAQFTVYDNSIRHYPKLLSPLKSLLGLKRSDIYDKSTITSPTKIDWAAGSFLLFTVACYEKLNGFDEKYFMYFEDVDICTRANKQGFSIRYFPNIKAIHYALHQNRKLFSKHFFFHCISSIRYILNIFRI